MRTPSRASTSARSRGIVQLRRSATGSSSRGVITRNAASLFTGAGPGATLAFSAATPPFMKSLRQRRTVSYERTIDAHLLAPLFAPGQIASLTVTLRLPGNPTIGQFKGVALLSQDDDPVNVHLEARGFAVISEPPPPLALAADRDSPPVAFQLRIEDTAERWLHVIIVQSGQVAGELVINNFDQLGSDTREVAAPMVRVQEADLAVIIHEESAIVSSPRNRACRFYEQIPGIKPLATPFRAMLQNRLKALYDSNADAAKTDRELRVVGVELARCLSPQLTELLRRGDVRTVLLRHDENFDFPLELCYLDDEVDPFFIGDRKAICRWFLGVTNPPDVVEKRIHRVAFLRGLDKASEPDEQMLNNVYPEKITPLAGSADVRRQLFASSDFDLIQFTGHCEVSEAGLGGLQMADGSFVRIIDIGQLIAERAFTKAQPFILLNACASAQPYISGFGRDSFAHRFITSQACAFIGTLWPVSGGVANDFAAAFHLALKENTVAGALLSAKLKIVEQAKNVEEPGDPNILLIARQVAARSYCLFAHPDLRLAA
jgi:CHAT domain